MCCREVLTSHASAAQKQKSQWPKYHSQTVVGADVGTGVGATVGSAVGKVLQRDCDANNDKKERHWAVRWRRRGMGRRQECGVCGWDRPGTRSQPSRREARTLEPPRAVTWERAWETSSGKSWAWEWALLSASTWAQSYEQHVESSAVMLIIAPRGGCRQ